MSDLHCCYTDEDRPSCLGRRMAGLPMCQRHMLRTFRDALVEGVLPADVFADLIRQTDTLLGLGRIQRRNIDDEVMRDHLQRSEAMKREQVAAREERSVVYYVQLTRDRIKIGFTTDLTKRLASYRAHADDLLAVEVGGRVKEAERHQQFASLRIGRSEDFNAGPALLEHVARLAGQES